MSETQKKTTYAEEVRQRMEEKEWAFSCEEREKETVFNLPMAADNAPGINVKLIVRNDGDCKLRTYLASNVPKSKHQKILSVLNTLNGQYRFICLNLDRDGDICASYDFIIGSKETSVAGRVLAMLHLFTDIADDCIPHIMPVIWSKED